MEEAAFIGMFVRLCVYTMLSSFLVQHDSFIVVVLRRSISVQKSRVQRFIYILLPVSQTTLGRERGVAMMVYSVCKMRWRLCHDGAAFNLVVFEIL